MIETGSISLRDISAIISILQNKTVTKKTIDNDRKPSFCPHDRYAKKRGTLINKERRATNGKDEKNTRLKTKRELVKPHKTATRMLSDAKNRFAITPSPDVSIEFCVMFFLLSIARQHKGAMREILRV